MGQRHPRDISFYVHIDVDRHIAIHAYDFRRVRGLPPLHNLRRLDPRRGGCSRILCLGDGLHCYPSAEPNQQAPIARCGEKAKQKTGGE